MAKKKKPDHVRWPAHAYVDLRDRVAGLQHTMEHLGEKVDQLEHRLATFNNTHKILAERISQAERVAKDALSQVGQWEWQVCRMKEQDALLQSKLCEIQGYQDKLKRLSEAHVSMAQQSLDRHERMRESVNQIREIIENLR